MGKTKSATGVKLLLSYGEAEIVSWEAPWRIEIYRPFEVSPKEPWNREIRERVMATGPDDSDCSCCYLNISHSSNKHIAGIQR